MGLFKDKRVKELETAVMAARMMFGQGISTMGQVTVQDVFADVMHATENLCNAGKPNEALAILRTARDKPLSMNGELWEEQFTAVISQIEEQRGYATGSGTP